MTEVSSAATDAEPGVLVDMKLLSAILQMLSKLAAEKSSSEIA